MCNYYRVGAKVLLSALLAMLWSSDTTVMVNLQTYTVTSIM